MIFYLYDPNSFELIGPREVVANPQTGGYSAPAHSTHVVPPALAANQAAVFSPTTGAWSTVPDWRGVTFYNVTTGAPVSLALGQVPDKTMSQIQPVINLVNQALAALGMSYTNTLYGTFTDANGNTWQVDATSRALMTGTEAKIAGGMVLPVNFSWLNLANVAVPMTADQFQALTAAMFAWTQAMFSQYQAQKTAISALTTIKAVQTYQIPAWPTSTSFSIPNAAVSNAAPASNASTTPMSSGS